VHKTKRQQAAALQTLRACQRPLHARQRVRNHHDNRRDRMGPYGGGRTGTGTLFVHESKAAASCRTPNASRLPTPTASAAAREKPLGSAVRSNGAIWGQTRSWLQAPQAAPWRKRKALGCHNWDEKALRLPRKRGSLAAMGCSAHWATRRPRPLESRL